MADAVMLVLAFFACVVGFAWLALAMDVHWQQVLGAMPRSRGAQAGLRTLGAIALAASLSLCLAVDHVSMASLVWIMTLAAAAMVVAFTLAWRPRWLALIVPWADRSD